MQQVHEQQFVVERYYIPIFEVIPSAPAYVLDSDVKYTSGVTRRDDFVSQIACPQRQHDRPGSRRTGQHFHPILSTSQRRTSSVGIYNLISIFYYYWNVLLIFDVIVTVASILLRCQFG
jgi:hypothetical protein